MEELQRALTYIHLLKKKNDNNDEVKKELENVYLQLSKLQLIYQIS